ncbi:MAG: class I SAM-dependent methyltransferase [Candidatus Binatia bacterium]
MGVSATIRRVVGRWAGARPGTTAGVARVHDVTSCSTEIDLVPLDVIRWAPCWMTRAERLLLYGLTFALRPERYLEIGTYRGGSAAIVATAMDALGSSGRVVCVDAGHEVDPPVWERIRHRATQVIGRSPEVLPSARVAGGGEPFDLVLIDGDHSYEGVLRDAHAVLDHVAPGAYLLCHDGFNPGVAAALDRFCREQATRVLDAGVLTREVTQGEDAEGRPTRWGGLRMMRVV